jgi:hypothetical protein
LKLQRCFERLQQKLLCRINCQQLFGDENPVGKELTLSDAKYIVTAVYTLPEGNSVVKPNYVVLSQTMKDDRENIKKGYQNWGNNFTKH